MDQLHRDRDRLAAALQEELDGRPADPFQVRRLVRRLRGRFPGIEGTLELIAERFGASTGAAGEAGDAQVA